MTAVIPHLAIADEDDAEAEKKLHQQWTGIRHLAMDWWCWLDISAEAWDLGWFSYDDCFVSYPCDITIVIKNPRQPEGLIEHTPHPHPHLLKDVTPGTIRAQAANVILKHITHEYDAQDADTPCTRRNQKANSSSVPVYFARYKGCSCDQPITRRRELCRR